MLTDFSTQIYKGVFWVPTNRLGIPSYPHHEYGNICELPPEAKKKKINTLYDGIICFQAGNFKCVEDNILIKDNDNILWTFHNSGLYSHLSNQGCCSSMAHWLLYALEGKYEECGLVVLLAQSGNGHVVNYIKMNHQIYIVDMTIYIPEITPLLPRETGNIEDYRHGKFLIGGLLMVDSLEDFADFFTKYMGKAKRTKFLIYTQKKECLYEGFHISKEGNKSLYLPKDFDIKVLINPGFNIIRS